MKTKARRVDTKFEPTKFSLESNFKKSLFLISIDTHSHQNICTAAEMKKFQWLVRNYISWKWNGRIRLLPVLLFLTFVLFFRLILTTFLKRQEPIDLRRLFCLFAHGTKATPLFWNKEGWIIAFCSVEIRDQLFLPF